MFLYEVNGIKISFPYKIADIVNKLDYILKTTKSSSQIVTLNTLIYLQAKFDYLTYLSLKNSVLILPDSFGISLICSIFSFKILKRYPGIDLIDELCILAKKNFYKLYLLGSSSDIIKSAKDFLINKYEIEIVGIHDGYIFSPKDITNEVIEDINTKKVDILLVGFPTEIQEKWIFKNLNKIKCKIVMGVGGSFDVISGKIPRAPKIFQFLGMEWYYRLLMEPKRFKRILKLPLGLFFIFFDSIKKFFNSK